MESQGCEDINNIQYSCSNLHTLCEMCVSANDRWLFNQYGKLITLLDLFAYILHDIFLKQQRKKRLLRIILQTLQSSTTKHAARIKLRSR